MSDDFALDDFALADFEGADFEDADSEADDDADADADADAEAEAEADLDAADDDLDAAESVDSFESDSVESVSVEAAAVIIFAAFADFRLPCGEAIESSDEVPDASAELEAGAELDAVVVAALFESDAYAPMMPTKVPEAARINAVKPATHCRRILFFANP